MPSLDPGLIRTLSTKRQMWTLVTGGAGYIGSHIVTMLLQNNHHVIICDNFCNSHPNVISKILKIANKPTDQLKVYRIDLTEYNGLKRVFEENQISAVINLAGLKAVGESVREPLLYYHCNISVCCNVLKAMRDFKVGTLIHSSSATVYGHPQYDKKLTEQDTAMPLSPYGHSKLFQEQIIRDAHLAGHLKRVCILRYFNPVGAHPSGLIGEHPNGPPNNLMPAIAQATVKHLNGEPVQLYIFGDDYPTTDGTGVRDYIHVMDLAEGHLLALDYIKNTDNVLDCFNLGSGRGYSVKEVIDCFERESQVPLTVKVVGRRDGDVPVLVASVEKAISILHFKCKYDLAIMCRDHWRWQRLNPNGYN